MADPSLAPVPASRLPAEGGHVRARRFRLRGVVQGVGFRPFVFRLARSRQLSGWVLNGEQGVEIHVEGADSALEAFATALRDEAPPAARVASLEAADAAVEGLGGFEIRASQRQAAPTVRISPDLPVCADCLRELFDAADRRHLYPYINCTNCGPRYSIVLALPYDRRSTTMAAWPLCRDCGSEYGDPLNRRFHAQPVACPRCGPDYVLRPAGADSSLRGLSAVQAAARELGQGAIVAVKGIGGYHLACNARDARAVATLRERKFRKERPFAVMVPDVETAERLVALSAASRALLLSPARPIVLAPARLALAGVAPGNPDLGVMLPYAPLHALLFHAGAPAALVMTSANRSSEPIAFDDADALERLSGLADLFLVGERPIARRVEDSIARDGAFGPSVLRRARGLAPAAVAELAFDRPILAVGADLKNAITLVVNGQAFGGQHIGDLDDVRARRAFEDAVRDVMTMYEVRDEDLVLAHDLHPEYVSTRFALDAACSDRRAVQHHRAHVASVLAERGAIEERVVGVAFDGTGYGDDGTIWGGEFFAGSIADGLERVAHLRPAALAGGDGAARHPVQASAGFLAQLDGVPALTAPPFSFPPRYAQARQLVDKGVRTFTTTSVGRLFDTVAALLGFTRAVSFEGQAAIWLEHLARSAAGAEPLAFPFDRSLDFRPALRRIIEDRLAGRDLAEIARAFHRGLARAVSAVAGQLAATHGVEIVVLSGGVFQNQLLLSELHSAFAGSRLRVWTNQQVPPNDGGISLGQAALVLGPRA